MNSKFLVCLACMLSVAIFAPSTIALMDLDSTTILVFDHNEEEESQVTSNDNDQPEFLYIKNYHKFHLSAKKGSFVNGRPVYGDFLTSLDILLPPPRRTA